MHFYLKIACILYVCSLDHKQPIHLKPQKVHRDSALWYISPIKIILTYIISCKICELIRFQCRVNSMFESMYASRCSHLLLTVIFLITNIEICALWDNLFHQNNKVASFHMWRDIRDYVLTNRTTQTL